MATFIPDKTLKIFITTKLRIRPYQEPLLKGKDRYSRPLY